MKNSLKLAFAASALLLSIGMTETAEARGCGVDFAHSCGNNGKGSSHNNNHNNNHNNSHSNSNSNSNAHASNHTNVGVGVHNNVGSNVSNNNDVHVNVQGGQAGQGGHGGQGGQGGSSNSNSGSSSNASNGPITISENHDYPTPIGNAPAVFIQPTGDCGEGYSLSIGAPFSAIGGGRTTQNKFCLSQKAATAAINAGLVKGDDGLVASGLSALRGLHPEFDRAVSVVSENLMKSCATQAARKSVVLLTQPNLDCAKLGR